MMHFWRDLRHGQQARSSAGASSGGPGAGSLLCSQPALRLLQICQGPESHAFVQPLAATFAAIVETTQVSGVPTAVVKAAMQPLAFTVKFLEANAVGNRHLEFALSAHHNSAATRQLWSSVEACLQELDRCGRARSSVGEAREQWREAMLTFMARCREVSDLHTYFVFLDVKGDKALLELTALRMSRLLQCPVWSLVAYFSKPQRWINDALEVLASGQHQQFFERMHTESLRQWRLSWDRRAEQLCPAERHRFGEDAKPSTEFWEAYFSQLFRVSWPCFAEAVEHYYLLGRCPVDVTAQLRKRVCAGGKHSVERRAWESLVRERRIHDVVDLLLSDALEDVGSLVYRAEPLDVPAPAPLAGKGGRPAPATQSVSSALQALNCTQREVTPELPEGERRSSTGWKAFAHNMSSDTLADSAIPTPQEMLLMRSYIATAGADAVGPAEGSCHHMTWAEYVARMCRLGGPWGFAGTEPHEAGARGADDQSLRVAALRMVNSVTPLTRRALVLRVVNGDLAEGRPLIELPQDAGSTGQTPMPSLVITANGSRFPGVTKFGRSSYGTMLPDYPMGEAVASRSHFNITYEQESDKYVLMDAGSKRGTFIKVDSTLALSCGDWIRAGGVEFIVRYCGGGCACRRRHAHHRLHSLRLLQDRQGGAKTRSPASPPEPPEPPSPWPSQGSNSPAQGEGASDELRDELLLMLGSRRRRGWIGAAARLGQRSAAHCGGAGRAPRPAAGASIAEGAEDGQEERKRALLLPVAPLELDFISGPRMGETVVLSERSCTLGRGEGNAIQVSDSQLTSISRVHCVFEYSGDRWHMRDNGSTNGTWRRLSCVLEPSAPMPLTSGMFVQAGAHEFLVEEAPLPHLWVPSVAPEMLAEASEIEAGRDQAAPDDAQDAMASFPSLGLGGNMGIITP